MRRVGGGGHILQSNDYRKEMVNHIQSVFFVFSFLQVAVAQNNASGGGMGIVISYDL